MQIKKKRIKVLSKNLSMDYMFHSNNYWSLLVLPTSVVIVRRYTLPLMLQKIRNAIKKKKVEYFTTLLSSIKEQPIFWYTR